MTSPSTSLELTLMPHEIDLYKPLIEEIQQLKQQKNAILLGHNYMLPEVYYISDFHGDSLELARKSRDSDSDIIVFNGVYFMAETAAIMNPNRTILIADEKAGCSLAESINSQQVRSLKEKYPGVPVVSYINCSAEVKAESDVCCTSSNALNIIEKLDSNTVIFLPDRYLAANVQKMTTKKIIAWENGTCIVHEQYTATDLANVRKQYPQSLIIAHPECSTEVTAVADFSGSTSQMSRFIANSNSEQFFLVTECGMSDNLQHQFPSKKFIKTCHTCPHMKKITLQKVRDCLVYEKPTVSIPEHIRVPALKAINAMFDFS